MLFRSSIGGTVIGVFIISLLQQGIMAFGLGKGQQMIITGNAYQPEEKTIKKNRCCMVC